MKDIYIFYFLFTKKFLNQKVLLITAITTFNQKLQMFLTNELHNCSTRKNHWV